MHVTELVRKLIEIPILAIEWCEWWNLSLNSHEAVVWRNVPEEGIDQKALMKNVGAVGKVGFSKGQL